MPTLRATKIPAMINIFGVSVHTSVSRHRTANHIPNEETTHTQLDITRSIDHRACIRSQNRTFDKRQTVIANEKYCFHLFRSALAITGSNTMFD